MPLTINVGLSRKSSRDYQSEGALINLTAELDQTLLTRPDALQAEIARLCQQAKDAMAQQSGRVRPASVPTETPHAPPRNPATHQIRPPTVTTHFRT